MPQSTWGKQPANWFAEDELARFELLVNKPGARLTVVRSPAQGWMDSGRPSGSCNSRCRLTCEGRP